MIDNPIVDEQRVLTLREKLFEVFSAINNVTKTGNNASEGYSYAEASEVLRIIREQFIKQKIICLPSASRPTHFTETGGRRFVTTVQLVYRLINVENGEVIELEWVGAGADIGGEKGLYKAYTGGLKYVLLDMFLLPTGDDPETDRVSETGDEDRDPAPRIPQDRAKAILAKAIEKKLATETDKGVELSAVLKAKLLAVGCERPLIGTLNVDQVEDVESWIGGEEVQ